MSPLLATRPRNKRQGDIYLELRSRQDKASVVLASGQNTKENQQISAKYCGNVSHSSWLNICWQTRHQCAVVIWPNSEVAYPFRIAIEIQCLVLDLRRPTFKLQCSSFELLSEIGGPANKRLSTELGFANHLTNYFQPTCNI